MSFTVFLGNLPTWVTADDIKQWLAAEDLVADGVKVIRNHETQESKGFAFVEAPTNDEMQSIIRRFDRAPLEDRLLRANPAQPPKGKDAPRGAAVPSSQQTAAAPNADLNRSSAVLTAPPWKTGCCAPTPRSRRKARMLRVERRCRRRNRPQQHPMPSEPNNVPTARSAVDEIASSPPALRLLPSWRRSCKAGLACPGGASHPWSAVHTCEGKSQPSIFYPSYFQSVAIGLQRAIGTGMKYSWLGCLWLSSLLFAGTQDSDLNVNKRYTVDTVIVAGKGWKTNVADQQTDKFSSRLRKDLVALIGQKLNPGTLDGQIGRAHV